MEIVQKVMPPVLVASIRYTGRYEDCVKYYNRIFSAIKFKAAKASPFLMCYDAGYKPDGADIEVCVVLKEPVQAAGVEVKTLPQTKVISTMHTGSYDSLKNAYEALLEYAAQNGLTVQAPTREIYIKGPGMLFKGNPDKYLTEVVVPIE